MDLQWQYIHKHTIKKTLLRFTSTKNKPHTITRNERQNKHVQITIMLIYIYKNSVSPKKKSKTKTNDKTHLILIRLITMEVYVSCIKMCQNMISNNRFYE